MSIELSRSGLAFRSESRKKNPSLIESLARSIQTEQESLLSSRMAASICCQCQYLVFISKAVSEPSLPAARVISDK